MAERCADKRFELAQLTRRIEQARDENWIHNANLDDAVDDLCDFTGELLETLELVERDRSRAPVGFGNDLTKIERMGAGHGKP